MLRTFEIKWAKQELSMLSEALNLFGIIDSKFKALVIADWLEEQGSFVANVLREEIDELDSIEDCEDIDFDVYGIAFGDGDGYGRGDGRGDGRGNGRGNGIGNERGDGFGDGSGMGNGWRQDP